MYINMASNICRSILILCHRHGVHSGKAFQSPSFSIIYTETVFSINNYCVFFQQVHFLLLSHKLKVDSSEIWEAIVPYFS